MLYYIALLIVAYWVADFLTSLYHLLTDRGYNTKRIVANFLNHHDQPWTMTFDLEPMLGGIPLLILGWYFGSFFLMALAVFVCFAQVPHYYTHHPAPAFVKFLQRCKIFLPPESHQDHHNSEKFDRNFSVINGWSNWLVNIISKKISA